MNGACEHARVIEMKDDNADRTRTVERCETCGRRFYGCFAKRLDDEARTAWGPVGEWWYREAPLNPRHVFDRPERP